jgi:hypothetical protein
MVCDRVKIPSAAICFFQFNDFIRCFRSQFKCDKATWNIKMKNIRKTSVANNRNTNGSNFNSISTGQNMQKSAIFSEGMNLNYMRTFQSDPNSPKHVSISYESSDHSLIYESVVLFYSLSAFLLQILHLYRTVWWLPQSYEKNALVSQCCVLLWTI